MKKKCPFIFGIRALEEGKEEHCGKASDVVRVQHGFQRRLVRELFSDAAQSRKQEAARRGGNGPGKTRLSATVVSLT